MARNCYAFAFLAICSLLCVSALEQGGHSLPLEKVEKKEAKVVGEEQVLRLPSVRDEWIQAIPMEQSPIRIPSNPTEGYPFFEEGRHRPVRFRLGRPGGCHDKYKHFLMPRDDRFSRRMGMGRYRHAHARHQPFFFPAPEETSSRNFHADLHPQREAMVFEKQREMDPAVSFVVKEEEQERGAPWTAWLRSLFD